MENYLSAYLSDSEIETVELELSRGKTIFAALASLPAVRLEALKSAAEQYNFGFAESVPENARQIDNNFFVTDKEVYCVDPFAVPAQYAVNRTIIVVPPIQKEQKANDFWAELISKAVREGWGDIHYEPSDNVYRIRIRNDIGRIETIKKIEKETALKLLRRFLVLANINTSNLHIPLDGSISFADISSNDPKKKGLVSFLKSISDTPCDMRISVIPTVKGPSCVIRILPKNRTLSIDLRELGYTGKHIEKLSGYPSLSQGMILMVGPTGSGKSTLIWAMLKMADPAKRKIVSIEDPVEAEVPGVQQVEVRLPVYDETGKQIGVDFATAIRAFMRQNPDVIAVGEIRDTETARAAIQASNTGHLLISTLHANDETQAIKRLLDLAQDPDIAKVVNQMRLIVAQRLLPKLCPRCIEMNLVPRVEVNEQFLARLPVEVREIFEIKVKGQQVFSRNIKQTCGRCKGGFVGRIPVVGILEFNRAIRDFIIGSGGTFEMRDFLERARAYGFRSYVDDAVARLRNGEVALEDVMEII